MDDLPAQEVPRDAVGVGPIPSNADAMAPNIIGLGLIVAGVLFMAFLGLVGFIIGLICIIGGVGAMWMTWQRKRRATA